MTKAPGKNAVALQTSEIIDYKKLYDFFQESMLTKMRGHVADIEYLETWVPDPDIVRSIINMVDAAQAAGRDEIHIRVIRNMFSDDQIKSLEHLANGISKLNVTFQAESVVFGFSQLSNFSASQSVIVDSATLSQTPNISGAGIRTSGPEKTEKNNFQSTIDTLDKAICDGLDATTVPVPAFENKSDTDRFLAIVEAYGELTAPLDKAASIEVTGLQAAVDFIGLPLAYRRGVRKSAANTVHAVRPPDAGDLVCLTTEDEGVELGLHIHPGTNRIRKAWHAGTRDPVMLGIMEAFCRTVEKTPLQDASDYSGFKLLHNLRDFRLERSNRGINMSVNIDPALNFPVNLVRKIHHKYVANKKSPDTENFFEAPPGKEWVQSTNETRELLLHKEIQNFAVSRGLAAGDIMLGSISNNTLGFPIRVTVSFSPDIKSANLPSMTLALERFLKDSIEDKIQLFCEEYEDQSKLRRMSGDSVNKFK